jgi:hypothetical protein
MIKVKELCGLRSLRAFNAYNSLMLGLKMLPLYMSEPYEEFYLRVSNMPPEDQEKLIREAASFVNLEREEIEAMLLFCLDQNGVPYSTERVSKMGLQEIFECVVAVAKEIGKIKIDMVSESEKKNSETSQLI